MYLRLLPALMVVADLALVVERHSTFYRAATCLTLDMAYNNARQIARPDRDWLQPYANTTLQTDEGHTSAQQQQFRSAQSTAFAR